MIISIPTEQGTFNLCLNAPMIKFLACAALALVVIVGYAVVQLSTFILACTPEQFIRIVLFTLFLVGIVLVGRFLLNRKGATL